MKIPNQSNVSFNAMMPQEGATPGQLASNTVNTEILSYAVTKTIRSDKTTVREGENARIAVTVVNRWRRNCSITGLRSRNPTAATMSPAA